MKPTDEIWPPPPKRPKTNTVPVYAGRYLTGINWLDAVLGIPAGFLIGFVFYATASVGVQAVRGLPLRRPELLAICLIGFILSVVVYVLAGRRYSLFGFTMFFGGVPFYLLMLFLAWFV